MPIITVQGLPPQTQALHTFREAVQRATAGITGLGLRPDQTTVFFPADLLPPTKMEVMITVVGLFDKPERTTEVRRALADALLHEARVFIHAQFDKGECQRIEVLVMPPFKEEYGIAVATPK